MEEAPVTVATGALGPVVAKLSALLRRRGEYQYHLRRGTRKDVKLIRSKLKSIHSILWTIWEREDLDAGGKELRVEAWRLADDMNDAIDDFVLSMTQKGSSNDGKRFIQAKIEPSPFQDLKKRADDVSQQCRNKWKRMVVETAQQTGTISSLFSRRKYTVDDSGPGKRPRADPYIHKDISQLLGMEKRRKELIDHLVGEGESTPQLEIACILGAAGVGKTTLARLVYEAIEDKFDARAFVSVTSSRNMTEVLASIHQQVAVDSTAVSLDATDEAAAEKHLSSSISNSLKDKRYLVVIDDIWRCGEWETIKGSLPDNNLGSRIVTTTRVKAITEKWCDDYDACLVHKINYLNANQLNDMIDLQQPNEMVGESFDRNHRTVLMCDGMPLAAVCMISALAKERQRQGQQQGPCELIRTRDVQNRIEEQVKRNGIQNIPGFEPLVESLELGYNHLPHHMLKTCLLYFSTYPQGHSFSDIQGHRFTRDDLVRRWIAQGFACKEEAAQDYYDELVGRGLIINVGLKHPVMHPMIRSYLRCKLRRDNFITCTSDGVIPPSPTPGRLCMDGCWPGTGAVEPVEDPAFLSGIDWHHARSLVIFQDAERVPYDYEHLQHLRVLDVQEASRYRSLLKNQHLKDMCVELLRLRHLLLLGRHEGRITEIPAEIARLQHLETLQVSGTGIRRLPAEIGELKQLKALDVSHNKALAELPREIGKLQQLETLRFSGASIRAPPWEIIGTLKKLKTLDVSNNAGLAPLPRDIAAIGELEQLRNLNLSRNRGITELPKEIAKLQHLERLHLGATGIAELPREVCNLRRLKALNLSGTGITKLPRDIGKLHGLEDLALANTKVGKVPREIGGLKKLKNLNANIGTLPFEAGQISRLEGLPRCLRQAWKNSHLVSSLLAKEILSFEKINSYWGGDGGLLVGTRHMHVPPWIKEHFNNVASLDIRICKLEKQDLGVLREMPNLYNLILRFEAVPRKPAAIAGGTGTGEGFAKLQFLTVDSRAPRAIAFQQGAMPRLRCLEFRFRFHGGPPSTEPVGITHLVSLEQVTFRCNSEWYRGGSPCICATIDVVRKEALEHPTKKILFQVSAED